MKISEWHPAFKRYVERYVVVTTWEVERPLNYNVSTGFIPPLFGVHYFKNNDTIMGTGQQGFGVQYRLPRNMNYVDIPVQYYQGIHSTLAIHMVSEWREIADIQSLQMVSNSPVQVEEMGDAKSDWLITILWQANIQWIAELEAPVLPRYSFDRIDLAIRRANVLDKGKRVETNTPNIIDNRIQIAQGSNV